MFWGRTRSQPGSMPNGMQETTLATSARPGAKRPLIGTLRTRPSLGQLSSALRPAAVILTRPTSIALPPALTSSHRAVASPFLTRKKSIARVNPRSSRLEDRPARDPGHPAREPSELLLNDVSVLAQHQGHMIALPGVSAIPYGCRDVLEEHLDQELNRHPSRKRRVNPEQRRALQ
jgi:hypothetical protein